MRIYILCLFFLLMNTQIGVAIEIELDDSTLMDETLLEEHIFDDDFLLDDMLESFEEEPDTEIDTFFDIGKEEVGDSGISLNNETIAQESKAYKTISVAGRQSIQKKIAVVYYGKTPVQKRKLQLKLLLRIQSMEKKYIENEYALKVLKYLKTKI